MPENAPFRHYKTMDDFFVPSSLKPVFVLFCFQVFCDGVPDGFSPILTQNFNRSPALCEVRERPRACLHKGINSEVSTIIRNCQSVSSRFSHHWVGWLCHQTGPEQFSLQRNHRDQSALCPGGEPVPGPQKYRAPFSRTSAHRKSVSTLAGGSRARFFVRHRMM